MTSGHRHRDETAAPARVRETKNLPCLPTSPERPRERAPKVGRGGRGDQRQRATSVGQPSIAHSVEENRRSPDGTELALSSSRRRTCFTSWPVRSRGTCCS